MTSGIFDEITRAFVTTLEGGTLSLGAYSLPLLGAFALLSWYWSFGRQVAAGGGGAGEALAAALLYAVNIGVAYWLLVHLTGLATAAYQTFLHWGLASGGGAAAGLLLTPSTVVDQGFVIAKPLIDYADRQMGWAAMWNMPKMVLYILAAIAIMASFPMVGVALMLTQIEYHLAVLLGAVLIPFGVFGPTAFLTEFCLGWIVGSLLRVLVTSVLVGAGFPLFSTAVIALTAGNDPTLYSAIIVALISLLYAGLTWWVPNKASTMCGRVALGLSGATVVAGAMGAGSVVLAGAHAIRGASQLLQRRTT
jgi:type IV secretion system protein TrbL